MKITNFVKLSLLFGLGFWSSIYSVAQEGQFTVMAINDVYNIEGVDADKSGGIARARSLRDQLGRAGQPVLLIHAGDFLFPSSMSVRYNGEQMVSVMNLLDGKVQEFDEHLFVTFGNHEFDKKNPEDISILGKRLEESEFTWLASNIDFEGVSEPTISWGRELIKNKIIEIGGVKVGLFSITTNMAEPDYVTIDADYEGVARRETGALRAAGAEVVIAVTHLRLSEDTALIEALGRDGPDVIFGGHEHNRLSYCNAEGRCVIKADADARSATVAKISLVDGQNPEVSFRYAILDETTIDRDETVQDAVVAWNTRYEEDYCREASEAEGCLRVVLGKAGVDLIAEELEIRRYETNLGAYIADQMIAAFDSVSLPRSVKPQIALINSGSLRFNQNIPAGTNITQRHLDGIFQYPVALKLITITGETLQNVLDHSVEDWTGNGWWLQSSGVAFKHNTANGAVSDLSLVKEGGDTVLVRPEDEILAVVSDYIATPGPNRDQDGYTMLNLDSEIQYGAQFDLKTIVTDSIIKAWNSRTAISPALPGRVCSSDRESAPCLLNN